MSHLTQVEFDRELSAEEERTYENAMQVIDNFVTGEDNCGPVVPVLEDGGAPVSDEEGSGADAARLSVAAAVRNHRTTGDHHR